MTTDPKNSRQFVRHPSDIPIEITEMNRPYDEEKTRLQDVSFMGLSFVSRHCPENGSQIYFRIPFVNPVFEANGRVVWSSKEENGHRIGVEFLGKVDAYRGRMVEQVCYIEHYRRELSRARGVEVSSEEAAKDWIEKYAADFPPIN